MGGCSKRCRMNVRCASACTFPWLPFPLSDKERGRGESSRFLSPAGSCVLLTASLWLCPHTRPCDVCPLVSNLCTQLNDPSLNNGDELIFHLYQQDGLIHMGAIGWVAATRHPPVNHLRGTRGDSKRKLIKTYRVFITEQVGRRGGCRSKTRADELA